MPLLAANACPDKSTNWVHIADNFDWLHCFVKLLIIRGGIHIKYC
ncbi:hypothetical protein SPONN_1176 [uncultured Candidatus Thioglobus sp.]|nr:hypothetical protein SPONN_1176 [uncultured Candidatus Thioglobus sp.]